MGRTLPPGFRFHPTDAELLKFYLKRKLMKKNLPCEVISELDIYKYAPWDLPDKSHLRSRDLNWYFFCPRDKKYSSGARFNRATEFGHWKATGKDRSVNCNDEVVGFIKTLIFHRGRAPKGERTDWVMHEYRLEDRALVNTGIPQDAYVLCKIFEKDGLGPRNSIQYGAPFNEEEWDGEEEVEAISIEASPSPVLFAPSPLPQSNDQQGSTASSSNLAPPEVPTVNTATPMEIFAPADDGIPSLLCIFGEEDCLSLLNWGSTATQGNSFEFSQTVPQIDPEFVASSSNLSPPEVPVVNSTTPMESFSPADDGILSLLCIFRDEECPLLLNGGSTATQGNSYEFGQTVPQTDPEIVASSSNVAPPKVPVVNSATPMEIFAPTDDGILSLLCFFREEDCPLLLNGGSTATRGNCFEFSQTVPDIDPGEDEIVSLLASFRGEEE